MTETEQKRLIQSRQAELAKDLEKVKAARMAREHERSLREREKDRLSLIYYNFLTVDFSDRKYRIDL